MALSTRPEDRLIVCGVAIGILDGQLRLANTTQAADSAGLGEGRGLACSQLLFELGQHLFASREDGVALIGNGPDWREERFRHCLSNSGLGGVINGTDDSFHHLFPCGIGILPGADGLFVHGQNLERSEGGALPIGHWSEQDGDNLCGPGVVSGHGLGQLVVHTFLTGEEVGADEQEQNAGVGACGSDGGGPLGTRWDITLMPETDATLVQEQAEVFLEFVIGGFVGRGIPTEDSNGRAWHGSASSRVHGLLCVLKYSAFCVVAQEGV